MRKIINSKTGVTMPDPGIRVDKAGRYRLRNGWIVFVDNVKKTYVLGWLPKLNAKARIGFENFADWQWARAGGRSLTEVNKEFDIVAPAGPKASITTV